MRADAAQGGRSVQCVHGAHPLSTLSPPEYGKQYLGSSEPAVKYSLFSVTQWRPSPQFTVFDVHGQVAPKQS